MFVDKIHSLWNWVFLGRGGKASRLAGIPVKSTNTHRLQPSSCGPCRLVGLNFCLLPGLS